MDNRRGYRIGEVQELTALSYRQIDYWVRSGLIAPLVVQKGKRMERVFNFENLVVIRAAMQLLDFGVDFTAVKKAAAWLQESFSNGRKGSYLFVADGEEFNLLTDDPAEIIEFMKGRCVLTIDIAQIAKRLKSDTRALSALKDKKDNRRRYAVPVIESA